MKISVKDPQVDERIIITFPEMESIIIEEAENITIDYIKGIIHLTLSKIKTSGNYEHSITNKPLCDYTRILQVRTYNRKKTGNTSKRTVGKGKTISIYGKVKPEKIRIRIINALHNAKKEPSL